MKLKNKKTGVIRNFGCVELHSFDPTNSVYDEHFDSISKLNEKWEDYEEPKVYYYISDFGAIRECEIGKFLEDEEDRKLIGNYFLAKEEAYKALVKLESLEQLEDKYDIKFGLDFVKNTINFSYKLDGDSVADELCNVYENMKAIFGGEDE